LLAVAVSAATIAVGVPAAAQATGGWKVQPVPLPSGATVAAMVGVSCPSATDCEAVLNYQQSFPAAAQWNGSNWTIEAVPNQDGSSLPTAVSCSSATNCMVVGFSDDPGVLPYTALWNGSTWTVERAAGTELYGVSCPSAKSCTAVGYSFANSTGDVPVADRWNGAVWKSETVPPVAGNNNGSLRSVSCVSATDCVAVGSSPGQPTGPELLAFRWDGTSWTQQTLPLPAGATSPELTGVSCTSASNCTAVGYDTVDGGNIVFAEHSNGSTWTVQNLSLPTGSASSSLASVSCASATCTAAGEYFVPTGAQKGRHPLAEVFNGTTWSLQATAAPSFHKLFTAISCVAARTCTAVGSIFTAHTGMTQPLAEHE
jgi:hypothetical protein